MPSHYLARAAEQIDKAAESNERVNGKAAQYPNPSAYQRAALEHARAYADLAAIEEGVVPASLVKTILDAMPVGN